MRIQIKNILLFGVIILLGSCEPDIIEHENFEKSTGVFILNEGNFTFGNASLSFLDLTNRQIENQVFFQCCIFDDNHGFNSIYQHK